MVKCEAHIQKLQIFCDGGSTSHWACVTIGLLGLHVQRPTPAQQRHVRNSRCKQGSNQVCPRTRILDGFRQKKYLMARSSAQTRAAPSRERAWQTTAGMSWRRGRWASCSCDNSGRRGSGLAGARSCRRRRGGSAFTATPEPSVSSLPGSSCSSRPTAGPGSLRSAGSSSRSSSGSDAGAIRCIPVATWRCRHRRPKPAAPARELLAAPELLASCGSGRALTFATCQWRSGHLLSWDGAPYAHESPSQRRTRLDRRLRPL
jgi:hypothetical protein